MAVSIPKIEHINPFLIATAETFSMMINLDIKAGKPYLKQGNGVEHDVSGIIGLSGGVKGSVVISFPRTTALKVISEFIGEKVVAIDNDVSDAIGELANIIAGAAKKNLTEYNINISLPTVVTGRNHSIAEPKDARSIIIPFQSEAGNFEVAINMKVAAPGE